MILPQGLAVHLSFPIPSKTPLQKNLILFIDMSGMGNINKFKDTCISFDVKLRL